MRATLETVSYLQGPRQPKSPAARRLRRLQVRVDCRIPFQLMRDAALLVHVVGVDCQDALRKAPPRPLPIVLVLAPLHVCDAKLRARTWTCSASVSFACRIGLQPRHHPAHCGLQSSRARLDYCITSGMHDICTA